jgi:adenylate cyclase
MATNMVTRKLSAILAADVVGYSRMIRADEEGTLAILKAIRDDIINPKIAEHHGRVVKLMGDGMLAEFGSVVDAVRNAVEVQQAVAEHQADVPQDRRIAFRVGINLGDVVIDGDDIQGDGVNVAARLEGLADPGEIWISGSAFEQVRDKLSVSFEDLGERRLKNIDRPVRVFRVPVTSASGDVIDRSKPSSVLRKRVAIVAVAIVATAAGGAVWWSGPWQPAIAPPSVQPPKTPLTDGPAIAVLPFESLGGEAEGYFSQGITEDIITALGRHRSLGVMALNATLPYKGKAATPAEVGRALGVRYLLEGSVRRAGDRVRVAARLTDADRGMLLWSEQFDEESEDVFDIQDAIVGNIAGMLIANLTRVEQQRAFAKPTTNLDAYDLVLRGRERLTYASRSHNREARELFEQAIELDPDYAEAYAWLARAHYLMATDGWTEFPARALQRAEQLAQEALAKNPGTIEAHRVLARVHSIQFQLDRAITEIDEAVALNPSDAEAHGDRGVILLWASRPQEAIAALDAAFAYNPNLRGDYIFAHGLAFYTLRQYSDAIRVLERGAARFPRYIFIPAVLVAAYGQLGRTEEARRNVEKVELLQPLFDPMTFGSRFRDPAHYEHLAEGLQKGGF